MLQNIGPQQASKQGITNPLPASWLGRADAPLAIPATASIYRLSNTNVQNLIAQIAYDKSGWDYTLVGTDNRLGRYQFSTQALEYYGLLAAGSNQHYGIDCVNYTNCWQSVTIKTASSYASYDYNITSLSSFLSSNAAQEHLAYQAVYDLYNSLVANESIQDTDTDDVIAGMIYVGWTLGVGTKPTITQISGTGAYAWRYSGVGNGTNSYNSGRYAITILSR
jgi:hypothetical protein